MDEETLDYIKALQKEIKELTGRVKKLEKWV